MIDAEQFRDSIVAPTLKEIGLYSKAAERLVIGTALTESAGLVYLRQLGDGPALGFWQMEPATHNDIWVNYLMYNLPLAKKLNPFNFDYRDPGQMVWNLKYACAMCRIHYYRHKSPLPEAHDIAGLARYWKDVYNTRAGKGKVSDFLQKASIVLEL